jgi:hypothetical protein
MINKGTNSFFILNSFDCDKITDYVLTLTKQKSVEQAHFFPANFDGHSVKQVTGKLDFTPLVRLLPLI